MTERRVGTRAIRAFYQEGERSKWPWGRQPTGVLNIWSHGWRATGLVKEEEGRGILGEDNKDLGEQKHIIPSPRIWEFFLIFWASQVALGAKQFVCQRRRRQETRKISSRRKWQPTPVFLLGNPMHRGAWRATVHGATKSQTQLPCYITLYEKNGGIITPGLLCWVV